MTNHHERTSLLDELDLRQNELIEQLDDLNRRIELTIQQHTKSGVSNSPSDGEAS